MHPKDLEDIVKRIRGRLCHIDVAWITTDIKDALLGADNPSGANTFLTEENLNNYLSQDIIDALEAATTASGSNRYATMLDLMGIEPGTLITVVANYAAFPEPITVSGQFYWAEASQGIPYTPDWFGGAYYQKGLYYSNGVTWEYTPVPFQATQAEVNTGVNNDRFVTPLTLKMSTQWDGVVLLAGRSGGQTIIGGTQVTDALTLQGTSGNGTLTDKAIRVLVGNNGATEALNITNNGYVNVGQRIYLGTATGSGRINLPDSGTTSADGITFGSDVNLYRSGANILKTDDSFRPANIIIGSTILETRNLYSTDGVQLTIGQYGSGGGLGLYPNNSVKGAELKVNGEFALTPPSLTGSSATSALSITQTWNTTGNPTAFSINLTDTASNAASLAFNIIVNGVSQLSISKFGQFTVSNNPVISHGSGQFSVIHGGTQHIRSNNSGTVIGTGSQITSARLAVVSTTQGFLGPVMTNAQRTAIASPAIGLEVYCTDAVEGKYIYKSTGWTFVI